MNTPSRRGAAIVINLMLLWGSAAVPAAELPMIRLEGVVERVESRPFGQEQLPPPWDQVQVGDPWSVTYRFDPAAPDIEPSPALGVYPAAIQWFEVSAGTMTRTNTVGPASAELRVFNDQPSGADQYEGFFNWDEGGVPLLMFFQLDDLQNQSFATDALPDCLDLASFGDAKDFQISAGFGGGLDGIYGRITGIACSPRIVRHPEDLTVTAGQPASFEVEIAAGGTPATYQWERDCGAGFQVISDATNRVHAIAATTPADTCQYRCVVSSLGLGSTSLAAALTVQPAPQPPVITQPPQGATLVPGETLTLGVTATGTGPLRHQWTQLGDPPTPRGTDPVLVLGPVSAADAGQYVVEVRDDVDAVVSSPAVVVVVAPGPFADDFEGYASGSDLHGQGGWHGWAENPGVGGLVQTERAFSPTRSVCIPGAGDLARRIAGVTGGQWVLTLRQFIPSTSTGTHYVNVMSRYRPRYDAPNLNWSVQIQCDTATARVSSDLGGGASLPLIKDEWIEIRCEIDLAANTVREFYHGQLLAEHPWHGADGDPAIAALDLYAHNSGPACYDDVRLEQAQPPVITQQPEAVAIEEGDVATFSVTATGAEPLRYQWLVDDLPIQDATNAVLLLGPVTTELSGTVTVRVSNGGGTLVSQGAPLTITPLSNNATGTRVPVDATICFSNAGSGAVADCIADWAAQGKATFQGGTYAAQTVHTRQARWCSIAAGPSTLWWPCHFNDTSDPTVPIPAGGPVAVSGTGVTSINAPLLLLGHAAYWQNHCTVWSNGIFPAGWEPAGFGYVHQVNVKMILGNGDEYVFAPKNSPPLGAKDLTPACPPEPMTICECPTVVELCFEDCATGQQVEINGDSFTATIDGGPFNGVQQASGTIGKAMCRKILLRSGEQYKLTIDYHTGTDYFTDRINWRTTVDVNTTNHNCSNAGPLTVPVPCFRDPAGNCIGSGGDPRCPFGEAHGNLNMLCECEHDLGSNWSFLTASGSWNGALQHRWDHVGADAATGCAEGRFDLMNLPTGMSPSTYSANGRMSFRTGNSYQWLQTPASSFTVQCDQRVDLGDTFVLDCGWVKGDIKFCGPVGCCLLSYIYREPSPELTGSFLEGSSYIGASGPVGAQSRGHFSGSTTPSPGCDFLGDYSLSLGGLNKGVSTWTANQIVLRYLNASPHIDSTVTITDQLFSAQTINPGATVTNDHDYCFSTVTVNFNVQTGGTGNYIPSVTASGSFVGTTGCLGQAADYSVHAVATGPSGPNPNQVVLSLPQGTYDFSPGITSGGHWTGLLAITNVPVGCKVCIEITPGLALVISDPPDCVSTNRPTFNVWLQNSNPAQILVNGIPTGPVIPANTVGAIHAITVPPAATLSPCVNNIVVTAQDTGTPPRSVSQTLKVTFDDVPPVISGCQDLHVTVPVGQSGATVTLPAVTATDNCGPVSVTCSADSGFFPVGETRVKCSATDACGNTAICEYTVTVDVCVGVKDVRVDCNRPASDFLVTFTYENPGPDPVSWLYFAPLNPCATVSPGFFHFTTPVPPGGQVTLQFTVNLPAHCPPDLCLQFTALNAQLMACCTVERCLELMDITCPEEIVVDCQDERGAWVDFGAVTASFNGTNLPVRCDLTSPAWFPIGVTPVACTYLDLCTDRERICKFTVTVRANGPGAWMRARNDVGNPAGTRGSIGLGIATDQCGDTVYVGSYDDGPLQVATVTLGAFGGRDGYLVKQDPLGNVLWAVRMGTAGGDEARAVATDAEGNIYVTGHVDGTLPATFDSWPTGSTTLLPVAGSSQQIFVARYDPQGVLQWFTRHGGSGDDAGIDIAVDGLGRPVVAGQWSVNGATEAFVARFGPWSGAVVDGPLWTTGGAGRTAAARGIALDGLGNAYLVGNHAGPTTFPPLALGLPSGGFIAKASPTLSTWAWARETYGNADLRGVGLDPTSGDVFITGYFNGTIKLDQAPLGSLAVANAKPGSLYDYLLARLDPATGLAHWLIKGGGIPTTAEETRDLAVDDQGNCYVTGFIHTNAPRPWVGTGQRVLVASYSGLGHIRWTRHADGGVSPAQAGHSLAVDAARCVHVTGEFTPALNFPNPPFTAPIPGLSLPAPPALGQTWVGHICPVCPCQDTSVDVRMHELSTGWNGAGGTAIPPGQADDDWVWYDPTTQTTQPAFIAGPAFGSPSRAPVMYQGGSWRLRHCLRLPGCIATQIRVHASSDDTSPNGISIYLNGNLVTTGAGNLGVTAMLTSGLTGGQDCLEITTQSDLPIAVAADVQALCGCGEIAGLKFSDANADRVRGGSEPGLPNWLVTFTDNTGNVIGSALTGTAGAYQSGLLFGGAYQVCEVQQSGWLQTFPATGCHHSVQVVPGSGASGVDFGNSRVDTITWDPSRHIGSFMIMWTGDGRLHTSAAPTGPWQVVPDATSPYAVPTTSAPQQFFQVIWP